MKDPKIRVTKTKKNTAESEHRIAFITIDLLVTVKSVWLASIAAMHTQSSSRAKTRLLHCRKRVDLFDDLVGACEQRQRYGEAKQLRGLEVDDKSHLVGSRVGRSDGFAPLRNTAGIDAELSIAVGGACSIADESPAAASISIPSELAVFRLPAGSGRTPPSLNFAPGSS
jgi:hypothetical protein